MKKFFKFISLASMLTIITASGLTPVHASEDFEDKYATASKTQYIDDSIIAEYEEQAALQYEATQAYSKLYDTFTIAEDGTTIHPNDYAGAWIEDAILHVALTSLDENIKAKYDRIFNGFNCVVYEEAEYSLNNLQEIQDTIYEELSSNNNISAYYTDVETNKIVFEAVDNLQLVKNEITLALNSTQPFTTENDSTSLIDSNLFVVKQGERINSEASITGGMEINRGSSSGSGRTISVCGTIKNGSNTYNGIITAGHNLATSGTNQILYKNGSEFGRVEWLMWKENGSGDWAAVKITNGDTITNKIYGSSSAYTRDIKATKDDLAKGTIVMKYGMASGYATGKVEAQNVTVNDGTYTITGITRCSLESGSTTGGDSGGPYYTQNTGNSYNYVGTHKASSGSGSNTKIYFTPYVRFKSYFTVKTN